jgi:hypothetical protein
MTGTLVANTINSGTANTLSLQSSNTTAITVDTSQNVGIGTSNTFTFKTFILGGTNTGLAVGDGTNTIYMMGDGGTTVKIGTSNSVPLGFWTASAERMRIDSSGNVGIGTTSPQQLLAVGNATDQVGAGVSGAVSTVYFGTPSNQSGGIKRISYDRASGSLNFIGNSVASPSTQMTLDSNGIFLVGTTAVVNTGKVISGFNGSSSVGFVANDTASASAGVYYGCSLNGTFIGSIQRVGATSAVVYNTTSDQRLKSNIADANSVLSTLMNVKVRQYDWTDGDLHQDYGFIAQELESVLSGVVTKGKTEEDMWQLDYSRLTPHLVKAIQELSAKNDMLEAANAAFEARLAAIEEKLK